MRQTLNTQPIMITIKNHWGCASAVFMYSCYSKQTNLIYHIHFSYCCYPKHETLYVSNTTGHSSKGI